MKTRPSARTSILAVALSAAAMFVTAQPARAVTYTWANSNVAGTPITPLDWLSGGPNTLGTWTGGPVVSSSANTIQFFQDASTALGNTSVTGTNQISNIDNGGTAFQLGTLTLNGKASATANANLVMTISGDPLDFSGATGTINLNGVNNTRTLTYNLNSNIQLGTASSGDALTIAGAGSATFNIGGNISELQSGGGSLIKSGASTLNLSGSNTFTGGMTINTGGQVNVTADSNLGAASSGITFNGVGTASLLLSTGSSITLPSTRTITVNTGAIAALGDININNTILYTVNGKVTGAGGILVGHYSLGKATTTLASTANDFTGSVNFGRSYASNSGPGITLDIASLADGAGYGNIIFGVGNGSAGDWAKFQWSANAITGLTLNNRQIEIASATTGNVISDVANNNASAANTVVINTDLKVSTAGAHIFELEGTNTGKNAFNGKIVDGTGAAISLTKAGAGTWILSGSNTYTGATTISAGVLRITNGSALGSTTNGTSQSGSSELDIDGTGGAVVVGAEALSINGGGNSNGGALRNIAGNNTYGGTVTLAAQSRINSDSGTLLLNNATAVTGAGQNLVIGGAGNITISGSISTTTGFLSKDGAGTLTLSASNAYTGLTAVNAGNLTLAFGGVASNIITASSALTLGGGVLQLTGTGTQQLNGLTTTVNTLSQTLLAANETLTLGGLTSAGANSALNFNTAAGGANATTSAIGTSLVVLTGQTAGNAINSGFTVSDAGGFGLATVNGSNQIVRLTSTALLPVSGATSATDYRVDNNAGGAGAAGSSNLAVTASQSDKSITVDTTTSSGTLTLNSGVALSNNTWNFGGTGSNTYQISGGTINSVASGGTITINNVNAGTVTFKTPIQANGANPFVVGGTGTTVLSGANTFTGATTISGGTLQIGSNGTIAGYNAAIAIAAGSTFQYSSATALTLGTIANITGAGGVTVDGGSNVTVQGGTSTWGGPTKITGAGSRLTVGNVSGALSANTAITIIGDNTGGGELSDIANATRANSFAISGLGNLDADSQANKEGALRLGGETISGTITLAGNSRIGAFVTNNTISGQITGPFGVDFYGFQNNTNQTSSFTLSNPANNYTGNTTIYNSCFNSLNLTGVSTTLKLGASNVIPNGASAGNVVFAINGADSGATDILDLNGFSNTINGLAVNAGTFATKITNSAAGASVLTIGANDTTSSFSGTITDGGAGTTLAITKTGSGTLTFTGANTYIGATLVSGGALSLTAAGAINGSSGIAVNGSSAKFLQTSSVAVTPTVTLTQGTLTGSGTINTVNVGAGGIISNNNGVAGASLTIGTLNFSGSGTVNTYSSSTTAPIITTSLASNAAGMVTINPTASSWANGSTYSLISYGGSIGGAGSGQFALGTVTGLAVRQTTVFGNSGNALTLAISGDSPYWVGDGDHNWNLASSSNWKLISAGTYTTFLANDNVLFNDSATAAGPISVNIDTANVSPNSTVFSNNTKNYILNSTGGFGIATGSVTMNGSGSLTINNSNSYTGGTNLSAGTLNASATGALGSGALSVAGGLLVSNSSQSVSSVTLGGGVASFASGGLGAGSITFAGSSTLRWLAGNTDDVSSRLIINSGAAATIDTQGNNVTFATGFGGASTGSLVKTGTGMLTLGGANTFTGNITVSSGTLNVTGSIYPTNPAATVTVAGGATLSLTGTGNVAGSGVNGFGSAQTWSVSGTITSNASGFNYLPNTVNLYNGAALSGSNASGGGVFLANTGFTTVNAAGATTINANVIGMNQLLNFNTPNSTDVLTVSSQLGSTTFNNNGAGLFKLGSGLVILTGNSIFQKPVTVSGGTLQIGNGTSGLVNSTTGGITVAAGANLAFDQANNTSATPAISNSGTLIGAEGANITNTISGAISGSGAFVQSGAGTAILSHANTYSGGNTLNAGHLLLGNASGSALGSGMLTLNGGTLGAGSTGVGSMSGNVLAGTSPHIIYPGYAASFGTLNLGGLTTSNLTTLNFNLGTTLSGGIYLGDLLNIGASSLSVGASTALAFGSLGPTSTGDYRLIGGTIGGATLSNFTLPASLSYTYSLSTAVDSGFIDLVVSPTAAAFTNPNYTLAATAAAHTIIVSGSSAITSTLVNSGTGSADSINYSGLTATGGTIGGSAGSGTLLPTQTGTASLAFTSATPGTFVISPTASVSGVHGTTPVLATTGTDSVTVLGHAAPSLAVTSGNNFVLHYGAPGALTATISLSNGSGTLSSLEVNASPSISSGSLSVDPSSPPYTIAPGSNVSYSASFSATAAGLYSIPVTFSQIGDNQSLSGALALASSSVAITGTVFSGTGTWISSSGSTWGIQESSSWNGGAAPGTFGAPCTATDTAIFSGSGTITTVNLAGSNPSLVSLLMSGSNYTLTGGSLALAGSSPTIAVSGGSQEIASIVVLSNSGALVSLVSGGSLDIGGNIIDNGGNLSLTVSGDGTGLLSLSGSNNFGGGVTVANGTLILNGANSLLAGSSLTIGSPSPGAVFAPPAIALAASPNLAPVPEPGTLALLAMAAVGLGVALRRGRKT